MESNEFKSFIEKYDFFEAGEIVLDNDRIQFTYLGDNLGKGFVYIWVEQFGSTFTVVYVGKAGKTLRARFGQHKGGFNGGSVTGIKNYNLIKDGLSKGKRYIIFARKSPLIEVLGEQVQSESIEEIALISKLKSNLWNRI